METDSKKYHKELYDWYKLHGICVQCGANEAAPNRVRCEECLAKNAGYHRRWLEGISQEEKDVVQKAKNQCHKNLRRERKEKGLCIDCGKPISKYSTCYCIDCYLKNKRRGEKRKYERTGGIDRSERPLYGRCYICDAPIESGKLCGICKERAIANLPKDMSENLREYHKRENALVFGKGA